MTPDELKARCKQYYQDNYPDVDAVHGLPGLESLCREMMAAGIQAVATHIRTQHLQEFGHARLLGCEGELYDWCQAEAQRVKENHDAEKA